MKKLIIDRGVPSTTNGFPPKSGTWNFLQDSYQEAFTAMHIQQINRRFGSYSTSIAYIMYGCELTTGISNTTITAGAVFFNGEVYLVDATSFANPSGGNVVIGNIVITQYGTNADPVQYTGGSSFSVHDIRKIVFSSGATGTGNVADYSDFISIYPVFKNDIVFESGWSSLGNPVYDVGYKIDGDIVTLCGTAQISPNFSSGTITMFTLPANARPAFECAIYTVIDSGAVGNPLVPSYIGILTTGEVSIIAYSVYPLISVGLDGISFRLK